MSALSSLPVEILEGESFDGLAPHWSALQLHSYDNLLFMTPGWVEVWWRHFGRNTPLFIVARDGEKWRGLLPLYIRKEAEQRILTLQGGANVADYLDALAVADEADDVLRALWRAAVDRIDFDRIELAHVPSESPLLRSLESLAGSLSLEVLVERDEVCPAVPLARDWDGYLATLSKKQRHEIRRKLRRFGAEAKTSFRVSATHADLDRDLATFFRLHHSSAADKAGFMDADMQAYFADMARVMLDLGHLRLSVLTRDGEDVAATMSFLYDGRYLLYNSGYDPAYAAHSPGIAAVSHAIQDAISLGAREFDFLSGNEPYKYQFGATDTHTDRLTASHHMD